MPVRSEAPGKTPRSMLVCCFLIGIAMLAGALFSARHTLRFNQHSLAADGTVVDLNAGGSHPQVRFTSASGDVITYDQGGLIFGYKAGDPVRVLYDSLDPRGTATLDVIGAKWFSTIILAVIGTIFVGTAAILYFSQ